jgi:hypothetical protein
VAAFLPARAGGCGGKAGLCLGMVWCPSGDDNDDSDADDASDIDPKAAVGSSDAGADGAAAIAGYAGAW